MKKNNNEDLALQMALDLKEEHRTRQNGQNKKTQLNPIEIINHYFGRHYLHQQVQTVFASFPQMNQQQILQVLTKGILEKTEFTNSIQSIVQMILSQANALKMFQDQQTQIIHQIQPATQKQEEEDFDEFQGVVVDKLQKISDLETLQRQIASRSTEVAFFSPPVFEPEKTDDFEEFKEAQVSIVSDKKSKIYDIFNKISPNENTVKINQSVTDLIDFEPQQPIQHQPIEEDDFDEFKEVKVQPENKYEAFKELENPEVQSPQNIGFVDIDFTSQRQIQSVNSNEFIQMENIYDAFKQIDKPVVQLLQIQQDNQEFSESIPKYDAFQELETHDHFQEYVEVTVQKAEQHEELTQVELNVQPNQAFNEKKVQDLVQFKNSLQPQNKYDAFHEIENNQEHLDQFEEFTEVQVDSSNIQPQNKYEAFEEINHQLNHVGHQDLLTEVQVKVENQLNEYNNTEQLSQNKYDAFQELNKDEQITTQNIQQKHEEEFEEFEEVQVENNKPEKLNQENVQSNDLFDFNEEAQQIQITQYQVTVIDQKINQSSSDILDLQQKSNIDEFEEFTEVQIQESKTDLNSKVQISSQNLTFSENYSPIQKLGQTELNYQTSLESFEQKSSHYIEQASENIPIYGNWREELEQPIGNDISFLNSFTQELVAYGLVQQSMEVNRYAQLIGEILLYREKKQIALQNEEYEALATIRDVLKSNEEKMKQMREKLYKYRDWLSIFKGQSVQDSLSNILESRRKDHQITDLIHLRVKQTEQYKIIRDALEQEIQLASQMLSLAEQLTLQENEQLKSNKKFIQFNDGLKEIQKLCSRFNLRENTMLIDEETLIEKVLIPLLLKKPPQFPVCELSGLMIFEEAFTFNGDIYDQKILNFYLKKIKGFEL